MILGFSTKINNKSTYFVEKILAGLHQFEKFKGFYLSNLYEHNLDYLESAIPKLHTIREDKNNRWKAGNKIDFFINVRKPNMFRFAPVMPVVSTQVIEFKEVDNNHYSIFVDGKILKRSELEQLAINDGFENVQDFLNYFPINFVGKIIHWTDLKY